MQATAQGKAPANKPFAEVIESTLDTLLAQSWDWDSFPEFGSLVQVQSDDHTILGCVISVKTGSMDPLRYPFPYQKTEAELKKEQPHIFEFLKTTFQVKVLGYEQQEKIYYLLPPKPAKIHRFIHPCPPTLTSDFFSNSDFLYRLFSTQTPIPHFDDLLLAIFNQLANNNQLTNTTINSFCQTFSLLTGNDYRRMKLFLKRVERITK